MGDEAADRHAGMQVQQRQHRVEHVAADVLEVDIDALRACRCKLSGDIGRTAVDAGVEAEIADGMAALATAASDADDARASAWQAVRRWPTAPVAAATTTVSPGC
ncbi:hypothetical protein J2X16_002974 [Pelomonas aquatica]|uniref:Uncharacterized protein n=1 Tax=Pelomonas aquatica TaxID=431058 RepID=A0ABU1ZAF8_9BURK|nr:hypothetical protein [Pelomonas aquatica]